MNSQAHKVHERSSQFFASKNYHDFVEELSTLQLPIKNPPFTELSLKCCGYGYFPHYKETMLRNFIDYLKGAIAACRQLTTLKIIFNGFNVSDGSLLRICDAIFSLGQKKKLKTLWLHTTNMRDCSEKEFITMFNIYERLGSDVSCEEISIQMADWEFMGSQYPSYENLVRIFTEFTTSISNFLYFKKFKLEMSCWYMKEKDAYKFLKETLDFQKLRQKFENKDTNLLKNEQMQVQVSEALHYFLQNLDKKSINPTYKYKKSDENYSHEDKNEHEIMINKMKQCEEIISKKMIKYPNEFITNHRVEEFHSKMTAFLSGLLANLPHLQEYHIDFRNWNSLFGMSSLKKNLDTKVNKKPQFSSIRRSLAMKGGIKPIQGQQIGLKTIYMM